MSDNIVCLIGLMTISFCISMWTLFRLFRRMDAEEAESRKKEATQLYPNSISITDLEQILESRKYTLAQLANNGDRLAFLYSLPAETKEVIEDSLRGAAHCQHWALMGYKDQEFKLAAQFAQFAKERLQEAYNKLNSTNKESRLARAMQRLFRRT